MKARIRISATERDRQVFQAEAVMLLGQSMVLDWDAQQ